MRTFILMLLTCTALLGAEVERVWVKVTAYCPGSCCCSPSADGTTSTGRKTDQHPYGIAADPRLLPYGTMIQVPGYMDVSYPDAWWEVDDTGGAMRQSAELGVVHLDLRFKHHWSAQQWGVRWMWVTAVRPPIQ